MTETVAYWLYDESCICPRLHGYVGISARLENRLREHRSSGVFPQFKSEILFRGTDEQCFDLEQYLRPHHGIGWNKAKGGPDRGRTLDYVHSQETRARVSAAMKGREITWRDKLSIANAGMVHSEETREKMSAARKGVPKSDAHRAAISAGVKKRYERDGGLSEETKRKISLARQRRR